MNKPLEDAMPLLEDGHFMFYVDDTMHEESGFRPSIVVEGTPGHFPNGGGDTEPWYWGHDLARAQQIAHEKNAAMGVTPEDEDRILMSSMRPEPADVEPGATLAEPARPSPREAADAANVVVIIEVAGGVVQTVYADDPLTAVLLVDRDNQQDDDCTAEERDHYRQIADLIEQPGMHAISIG